MNLSEKKLFTRRDLALAAALLVLCALLFLFRSQAPQGAEAVVERSGETVLRQKLSQLSSPKEVTVQGENGISLTVALYPDGVQILSADCPDQVCVRTGRLTRAGESAVCLPAGVSLRLEGSGGVDGETY